MKTRTMMMKVLIATVATIGVSSAAMADSAGHNSDVAAPKVTGKPKPVDECVVVRQMKYADATDVKTCIDTLVIEDRKNAAEIGFGMIWGKVIVVADKRTNKLFIVTIKPNMDFFDKLIEQLDIDMSPPALQAQVKVFGLQCADAECVASVINDFVGSPNGLVKGKVKVRADKRINGVVVMANQDEMPAIASIITKLDVKSNCESAIVEAEIKAFSDEWKSSYDAIMSHCDRIDELYKDAEVVRRKSAELNKIKVEKGLKSWSQIDPKILDEIDKKYPCSFMLNKTRQ